MIEHTIFQNLLQNEEYCRNVICYLDESYFNDLSYKLTFDVVKNYLDTYNKIPSKEAVIIELESKEKVSEEHIETSKTFVKSLYKDYEKPDMEWLMDKTEKYCQDKAIYNAILKSIRIMEGEEKKLGKGDIPDLLSSALAVSFDNSIGHDYLEDAKIRFDFYHDAQEKLPFSIDLLNRITNGGVNKKSLNVILSGTGVGKTLTMCDFAANNLEEGKNVLYITLEISEKIIGQRIDANRLDVTMDDIKFMSEETFMKKINKLKSKSGIGKLVIKEYPTSSASSANFRHLLNELKNKKSFVPDVIYIDYINICASSRLKGAANVNSYTYVKAIAEELRALGVEFNVPIWTATQTTRSGYDNSDVGMTDVSESFGLAASADFLIAMISTDELKSMNQIMVKQLKNRYGDPDKHKRFVVGVDRAKMRLYDLEESAQNDLVNDTPVMDNTSVGKKFDKSKFKDFK